MLVSRSSYLKLFKARARKAIIFPRQFFCISLLLALWMSFLGCTPLASQEYEDRTEHQKNLQKLKPSIEQKAPKRKAWHRVSQPRYEINFGRKRSGDGLVYSNELEAWARNRNLLLKPDLALRGLQDFEAALIPSSGLRFHLDAPVFSRVYLYLDLVTYRPLGKNKQAKSPLSWLEVIVNGRSLKISYQAFQSGPFLSSPLVIPVELEYIPEGKLEVFLRPAPHETKFAIWDAFVSSHPLNL